MTSQKQPRIEIIDALRGFALSGIFICHLVEQYSGAAMPEVHNAAVRVSILDQIIEGFIGIFLRGKFIALFSFLFGLSFFIQMDNGAKKGTAFAGRFLWKLLVLLGIGYLHSLFYRGDILTIYAMLGIVLIPFYLLKNKWVLAVAAILFLGLGRYTAFYFTGSAHLFLGVNPIDMQSTHVLTYYDIIKNGTLIDVFATNSWEGHLDKMNFQYGIFGRGYFTFAFFLVGLYVGRTGFFTRIYEEQKRTKKILISATILFVAALGITATAFIGMGSEVGLNNWYAMVGLAGYDLINLAMTLIYLALFVMAYRKVTTQKWLAKLAPYGRIALTNYVLQSLLGTLLLYGWGLGLLSEISNTLTFLLALTLIVLQVWASKHWLQRFNYGPLEWIWRSLTFVRWFSIKKTQ